MTVRQASNVGRSSGRVEIPKSLLDRLDNLALKQLKATAGTSRRAHARYRYRHRNVKMILFHSGGEHTYESVCTRNISAGGLAFLHQGCPKLDSRCQLILPGIDRNLYPVDAVIRSCRLVEGRIHEIGVEFREPVDVEAFLGIDVAARVRTG